jgi:hypothetical protein
VWDRLPDDISLLLDKRHRLENLYYIIDKSGNKISFNLNWAQIELHDNRFGYSSAIRLYAILGGMCGPMEPDQNNLLIFGRIGRSDNFSPISLNVLQKLKLNNIHFKYIIIVV